ncbi:MAG: S-adenosyl-L-methionine-dependent methyltransferase [Benjaminiella poitrasii]|nr:MAG: S-adenosyl-L-methionine-dependent methyltransferase [Benjaminiella poitrasii]
MRRSSWRKSFSTTFSRTTHDKNSFTSYSYFDDDDTSPRTSLGSEEENLENPSIKVTESVYNKRKKKSSFSSLSNDIVFESKYNNADSIAPNEEFFSSKQRSPKPFWTYNNGDEREYDRQLRQHYVLKHVLNGNIHVPIATDKSITILDSACGAGFWTLDMARSYPNAQVIGLDAFQTEDSKQTNGYANATIWVPNIVYKYGDLTTHLSLPDNYLDVIFQRDTMSIMPHERWPFLLDELIRIAKPGGYIELVEYDFNIRDPGPVLALVNEWYKIASTSVGVNPRETMQLKSMLLSAGFQNIQEKVISIPIGEWPTDEVEREKGFLYKQVVKALFKSMKAWWTSELAVTEHEYDKVINAAMDEFDEQRCYIDWVIYTAQKPLNHDENHGLDNIAIDETISEDAPNTV